MGEFAQPIYPRTPADAIAEDKVAANDKKWKVTGIHWLSLPASTEKREWELWEARCAQSDRNFDQALSAFKRVSGAACREYSQIIGFQSPLLLEEPTPSADGGPEEYDKTSEEFDATLARDIEIFLQPDLWQ